MALYIYSDKSKVPKGTKVVDCNDSYFDVFTSIDDSNLVKTILSTIDKADYHSDKSFIGRTKELGALNKNLLSTGTKTLLNIIQHPDKCFNVCECGANALKILPLIEEGKIVWKIPVLTTIPDTNCAIILNGEKHFTNFFDLQKYVIEKRGENL